MPGSRRWAARDVERLLRDGVDPPGGDAALLHRYLAGGDETAFEAIVDRHGPLVLSLCRRYLREPADVEDAFQATFLVLVRKGRGLRDGDALSSWLHGVARRVAIRARSDVLKRRDREGALTEADEPADEPREPADDALEILDEELARLPEKFRAPLVLCHLQGRTYDQAAAELGWPSGTVRSRMARARELLQGRLKRRGLDAAASLAPTRADLAAPLVPSSLVAATVAAAGRFAEAARSSLSSATAAWPAAALAQGVIAMMSPSPWKLLGLALAPLGLAAGALAVASGPLARQDKPPEASPAAAKTEGKPVDRRLDDLEAKIDRIAAALANPAPAPAAANVAVAPSMPGPGAAPPPFDGRSLREIEAQLLNAYQEYRRYRELAAHNAAAQSQGESLIQPVRILLARLRDMEDEAEVAQNAIEQGDRLIQAKKNQISALEREWREAAMMLSAPPDKDRRDEAQAKVNANRRIEEILQTIQRAKRSIEAATDDLEKMHGSLPPMRARAEGARRLIDWTRAHFKDVALTIDEAEPDAR